MPTERGHSDNQIDSMPTQRVTDVMLTEHVEKEKERAR